MQLPQRFAMTKGSLPIILIAAVVQGWALYALYMSVETHRWLPTESGWLLGLYSLAVFVPLTVQLLSEHVRTRLFWIIVCAIAVAYWYFGYHQGTSATLDAARRFFDSDDFVLPALVGGLLWLLLMPFAQVRLASGAFEYASLFTTAWRNKLLLAEAGLFTGLFWLLLALWQVLFNMLGIRFFTELFQKPSFVFPITTVVFGIALHLIGSVERLTAAILEQVLNVLKWLAVVAGIILALFTVALVFKLPGLVFEGRKAIGAAWLLWLVAVIVLLINAAYRDGKVEQPYPRALAFAIRCIVPLTVIISATALYALVVRARHYGITVERVWAFIVAGTALAYSIGYSIAALEKGKWLEGIGRANVIIAVTLIATLSATLTPVLSPYRLAANSQYRVSLQPPLAAATPQSDRSSSFRYLGFQAGRYGQERLNELSTLQDHPDAERIRSTALKALKLRTRWDRFQIDANAIVDKLVIFPAGHQVDAKLRQVLIETVNKGSFGRRNDLEDDERLGGIFIDLGSDSTEEFVFLHDGGGNVYQRAGDEWQQSGNLYLGDVNTQDLKTKLELIAKGNVSVKTSDWKDLMIGDSKYRITTVR